jgi:hypothetical protein
MKDEVLTALVGFGGSVIGAIGGYLGSLHAQQRALSHATGEREKEALRDAYLEWLAEMHAALDRLVEINLQFRSDSPAFPDDFFDQVRDDMVLDGWRVLLFEKDADFVRQFIGVVSLYRSTLHRLLDRDLEDGARTQMTRDVATRVNSFRRRLHERFGAQIPAIR